MKLLQNFLLAATLSEAQRTKKRQVLKSKLSHILINFSNNSAISDFSTGNFNHFLNKIFRNRK